MKIPDHPSAIPDVVVTCNIADREKEKRAKPFKVQSPLIIVEVLSPSTERYDRGGCSISCKFREFVSVVFSLLGKSL